MRYLELVLCSFGAGRGDVIQAWCCALFHCCLCPVFLQINHTVILFSELTPQWLVCSQISSLSCTSSTTSTREVAELWYLGFSLSWTLGTCTSVHPFIVINCRHILWALWLRQLSACSFWDKPCVNLSLLGLASFSLQCQFSLSNLYVCDINRDSPETGAQSDIKWSWTPGSG